MRHTIEALWNGDIAPAEYCGTNDPEIGHLLDLMERNREALCGQITAEQHKLFDKYIDSSDEYATRMVERALCDGFCLASKLMTESLTWDQ